MLRKRWKPEQRPTSATHAMRLGKERALIVLNLSTERIADLMGVTHDSLYKWLATGRMPAILIPAFELACGCNYVSQWLSTSAGKLVIDMPKGRKGSTADVMEVNTSCAAALALLTAFYDDPTAENAKATQTALRIHLEQVAYHHHNVASYATPQLEF
jgi:acetylornithine/succinyldiaminopimelate/putrescine aminotransferase